MFAVLTLGGCRGAGQEVSFRSSDGFLLRGSLFGGGGRAVVLSHGFPEDQSSWFEVARSLADRGYLALTYDFRGYGASEGRRTVGLIDRDVRAAIEFLRRDRGVERPALVGASMGGTASLIAAAGVPVAGVVTLSAPARFRGLDAVAQVGRVSVPKLIVAARGDGSAAASAEKLYEQTDEPREIRIVAGSAHGTGLLRGDQGPEVRKLVEEFLGRLLP